MKSPVIVPIDTATSGFTVSVNDCAAPGPLFETVAEYANAAPVVTDGGTLCNVRLRSAVATPVVKVPVALQPLMATTTERLTTPVDPAVNVIDGVFAPAVMVPPLIDQVYVVPTGPAATDALLPVDPGTTVEGAVIVVEGGALTVTFTAGAVPLQPVASVTVTLYEPEVETVIDCAVAPLDQRYLLPALAVRVTLPPVQKLVGPPAVIIGVNAPTLTFAVPLFAQPFASATETFNVTADDDVGLKVIAFVPLPDTMVPLVIVQLNVPFAIAGTDADAVLPAHTLDGALIVALGFGLTVTTVGADVALQPFASETVTV